LDGWRTYMRRASDCWTTVCCRDITHDTMHVADAASGSIDLSIAAASTRSRDDRIPTDEMNASDINRANDLSLSLLRVAVDIIIRSRLTHSNSGPQPALGPGSHEWYIVPPPQHAGGPRALKTKIRLVPPRHLPST